MTRRDSTLGVRSELTPACLPWVGQRPTSQRCDTIGMVGLGFDTVFSVFQVNAMALASRGLFSTLCGQLS